MRVKLLQVLPLALCLSLAAADLPKLSDAQKLAVRTAQLKVMTVSDKMRAAQTEAADIQRQIAELQLRLSSMQASWKDLLTQRQSAETELSAVTEKLYKEAKVKREDYDLDANLEFVPKLRK